MTAHLAYEATEPVPDLVVAVEIHDEQGELLFASDTEIIDQHFDVPVGSGRADLIFERIPFLSGSFTVAVDLKSRLGIVYDRRELLRFEVMNPGRSRGKTALEMRVEVRTPSLS